MIDAKAKTNYNIQDAPDPEKLTWAQIYAQIVDHLKLDINQNVANFQFASGFQQANWDEKTTSCHIVANSPPISLGPYFIPNDTTLNQDYESYINEIAKSLKTDNPGYKKAKTAYDSTITKIDSLNLQISGSYSAWKKNNPDHTTEYPDIKNQNDWLSSTFGSAFKPQMDELIGEKDDCLKAMNAYATDPSIDLLRKAYKNPENWQAVATSYGGSKSVPITEITPKLTTEIDNWKGIEKPTFSFDTKTATSTQSVWQVSGSSSASFSCFFGIYSNQSYLECHDIRNDSKFQLQIDALALENFKITRSDWFEEGALDTYHDGPFLDARVTTQTYFGAEKGSLKMIPIMIFVGYGITANVTITKTTYDNYKNSFATCTGVQIGPFRIDVQNSQSMEVIQNSDQTTTIKFKTPDKVAQIIGVLSKLHVY